jgi:hypothetical protein
MVAELRRLLHDDKARQQLADYGLQTIRARHTCAHRAEQLLEVCEELERLRKPRAMSSVLGRGRSAPGYEHNPEEDLRPAHDRVLSDPRRPTTDDRVVADDRRQQTDDGVPA